MEEIPNNHLGCNVPPEKQHDNGTSTMNEDVFPIENVDFPASYVSELRGVFETPMNTWDIY